MREKTAKLGAIARTCSIFGVTEVILYPDDPHRDQGADLQFCFDILTYIETPQYLRRRLFKLSPTFKFTGILPPLQTPPHNVPSSSSQLKVGDLREGVVVGRTGSNVNVDAGLKETIECQGSYRIGERVTLQLTDLGKELRRANRRTVEFKHILGLPRNTLPIQASKHVSTRGIRPKDRYVQIWDACRRALVGDQ